MGAKRERGLLSVRGRRNLVLTVLALAGFGLLCRAAYLQSVVGERLRERGDGQYIVNVHTPAQRGMIVDRHGEPLAVSTPLSTLWARPDRLRRELERYPNKTAHLARLVAQPPGELLRRLAAAATPKPVRLWEGVNPELKNALRKLRLDSVWDENRFRRYYPDGEITAHLIGFADRYGEPLAGLERSYNRWLSGKPGQLRVIKDSRQRPVGAVGAGVLPRPGNRLTLSIDRRLQYLLYRGLGKTWRDYRAKAAFGVIVDVDTFEILALVNQPGGDPNRYLDRDPALFRNRVAVDQFEPGSTLKPFSVAAALEAGVITPSTAFDTGRGWIKAGRFTIRDVRAHGRLTVTGILAKSSNVGVTQIAQLMNRPERTWRLYRELGFGSRTRLNLAGERRGRLQHYSQWGQAGLATHAYGYGLSVTALQLAQAYATLGAHGVRRPLSLQRLSRPLPGAERVLSQRTSRQVLAMLERAVQPGGTSTAAAVPGYRVAGKSGTAHKTRGGSYAARLYYSLFAGVVPVARPRLAMVVVIDEPDKTRGHFGGVVAAPVFSSVMRQALPLLGIPPDPDTLPADSRMQLAARDPRRP